MKKSQKIQLKIFKITFDKTFINFKNKVIWIESPDPPRKISQIQKKLALIFPFEEKRIFKIHLTIAGFPPSLKLQGASKDFQQLKNLESEEFKIEEKIAKISLFESKLGPKEANYKVLFTSPVKA